MLILHSIIFALFNELFIIIESILLLIIKSIQFRCETWGERREREKDREA